MHPFKLCSDLARTLDVGVATLFGKSQKIRLTFLQWTIVDPLRRLIISKAGCLPSKNGQW